MSVPSRRPPFSPAEYRRRIDGLRSEMARLGVDAALILDPADLVYFTGLGLHAQLVVPAGKEPVLLVQINDERARAEAWISDVRPSRGYRTIRETLSGLGLTDRFTLGLELDVLPAQVVEKIRSAVGQAAVADISAAALGLRMIKSEAELAVLERAAAISASNFEICRGLIRPGVTEAALAAAVWQNEGEQGADGWIRNRSWNGRLPHGVVVSGPGTAEISGYWMTMTGAGPSGAQPYGSSSRALETGDLVVLDRGMALDGYIIDEARTFVVGEPDARQQRAWDALHLVIDAAIGAVRPGAPVAAVYQAAFRAAQETGIAESFMTRAVYDFEYLGHGVGLEIDEGPLVAPRTELPLAPGMVLALEPKVIVPGWGGLTLEETVVVTPAGCRILTRSPRGPLAAGGQCEQGG